MPAPAALIPVAIAGATAVFRMVAPKVATKLIKEGIVKKLPTSVAKNAKNAKNVKKATEQEVRQLAKDKSSGTGRGGSFRQRTTEQRLSDAWKKTSGKQPPASRKIKNRSRPQNPDKPLNDAWTQAGRRPLKPKPKAPKPKSEAPKPKSEAPKPRTKLLKGKLTKAVNNPLLPAAIGLTSVANLPDNKKPMPPIKEKGYVKTIPKPKSTKLPSSVGIDTDDFSEEKESYKGLYDKKENASKKSNARKKKDKTQGGRFKHYDSDFARKYDIMYRTNKDPDYGIAGPKSEEDISGGYTGGQVKKLKKGGRPSSKGKSGFRGKGAGCAKRGY
jgi:hypothetical protein